MTAEDNVERLGKYFKRAANRRVGESVQDS